MSARFIRDITSGSVAALGFLLWENLITFDREVEYIWSKPSSSWIKWSFLFARYFPLIIQICNRGIELMIFHGSSNSLSIASVRVWYACQVMVAHVAICSADLVLMARVYAFYNQNRYIRALFLFLIVAQTIAVAVGLALSFPGADFTLLYVIIHPPKSYIYLGASVLVTQITILTLSIINCLRTDWGGAAIVSLLIRDGMLAFGALSFTSLLVIIYTALDLAFSSTLFAWFLAFVSATECRIILNMQSLSRAQISTGRSTTTMQMTTFLTQRRDDYMTEDTPADTSESPQDITSSGVPV